MSYMNELALRNRLYWMRADAKSTTIEIRAETPNHNWPGSWFEYTHEMRLDSRMVCALSEPHAGMDRLETREFLISVAHAFLCSIGLHNTARISVRFSNPDVEESKSELVQEMLLDGGKDGLFFEGLTILVRRAAEAFEPALNDYIKEAVEADIEGVRALTQE